MKKFRQNESGIYMSRTYELNIFIEQIELFLLSLDIVKKIPFHATCPR